MQSTEVLTAPKVEVEFRGESQKLPAIDLPLIPSSHHASLSR